ncbi:MAG TPA: hypothetical protein VKP13_00250 [Nitrospira sp.]|nr:hypothetical protein [Nitrospira sp.]
MRNPLMRMCAGMVLTVGFLAVAGCGGTGQTFYLDVIPKPQPGPLVAAEPVKIVIEPFEDRRVEKNRMGMRTHLWGGVTYFNVAGEKPGEVYAQALADRLKARGWQDRSWDVRVAPAGSVADADIVISGQIFEFSANAKSKVFSTSLTTSNKLTIVARNNVDRSSTSRSLEGAQSDTVFWFGEEDVQKLMTGTVKDTLDRYLSDTTISQRALRPIR